MDSMEVNKVIAAVLTAGIVFMATGFIGEILVSPTELAKPAIAIATAPAPAAGAKAPGIPSIAPLLAKADVTKGSKLVHQVCAACHSLAPNGPTIVGPHLYGVVGRPQGAVKGFAYSAAFKSKMHGVWSYHELNHWLYDPIKMVPGTHMTYAGIPNSQTRADVIAYLRTLSPHPLPLPKVTKVAAAAPAKAAGPAKPAGDTFALLVAKANPAQGKTVVNGICAACHTLKKGQPSAVGPNLWDVVGRKQGAFPGFAYSSAFKKKMAGVWTYDELNQWLTAPMTMVPGTHMAFAGIPKESERAAVVAYLRTLSGHPAPLPAAK